MRTPLRLPRRGANAVEFALILPVLLAFGFGIIDLGWMYLVRHAAGSAAAAGARAGAVTPLAEDPVDEAIDAATERWAELGLPASPTIAVSQGGAPQMMVVRVEVDLAALTGFVVGPDTIVVSAVQRMEEQP